MSTTEHTSTASTAAESPGKPVLLLAEYDTVDGVLGAASKLRDAGYKQFDTHTPFPVHGMDRAMGLPDSRLGWIVLAMGATGLLTAIALITWANGISYPFILGGKPAISIPAYVPICFELTVLFSSFGAVFGMLGLNRLPQHHHPIFESDRFRSATDHKFFVSVECADPKFDPKSTRALLESAHPANIETLEDRP